MYRTLLSILGGFGALAGCGGGDVAVFDAQLAEYYLVEGETFPGSVTLPENLPTTGARYDGAALMSYREDGVALTGRATAEHYFGGTYAAKR